MTDDVPERPKAKTWRMCWTEPESTKKHVWMSDNNYLRLVGWMNYDQRRFPNFKLWIEAVDEPEETKPND